MKLSDPAVRDHQAWIGYLQPDGLVVSAQALADQQVVIDKGSLIPLQDRFREFVCEAAINPEEPDQTIPVVPDIPAFLTGFLEWPAECIAGLTTEFPIPDHLRVPLREFHEELAPSLAFYDLRASAGGADLPILLVAVHPAGTDLDAPWSPHDHAWSASHTRRFERLLRETRVAIGLIAAGSHFRLVYAPRGENTGTLTFPVGPMQETAGRPILGAFHLLLDCYRLLGAATAERLPSLLVKSRDYQSAVSETLARQVLEALYELLRGFQAADDRAHGALLGHVLSTEPDKVYSSLITVLLRLVFVLYAEDRGLMPGSGLYVQNYAVHGLFERLRADAERYPDTMDHRYGAWPQLLALFRAIHGGCPHPHMKMPARSGHLFDPKRFPFLEGTADAPSDPDSAPGSSPAQTLPLLSDGTVFRVLSRLLLLNGERLSYRTLDVWHIGGVYQQMMGFQLQTATGPSIAIRAPKSSGAPAIVDLHALLEVKSAERSKWLTAATGQKLTGEAEKALKAATSTDDLLAALEKKIDRAATPHPVPGGAMILQPSDERRRSGSHYTPPALTGPIVEKTLAPILKRLAAEKPAGQVPLAASLLPMPEQILDLKICDPAMGSAAFLVETCRQLADVLVASWHAYGLTPRIPPDEDEVLHARRLIAQRCLYGVDRNPLATDLAKLSLWLATLAKDHPFTFLDHAFRTGDALVGLTLKQISRFHWDDSKSVQSVLKQDDIEKTIRRVREYRDKIFALPDHTEAHIAEKRQMLSVAEETVERLRAAGDLCLAAFFAAEKPKERESLREQFALDYTSQHTPESLWKTTFRRRALLSGRDIKDVDRIWSARAKGTQEDDASAGDGAASPTRKVADASGHPVTPFHWEIEFPEVFGRENPGFDAFVGNPPFMGGKNLSGFLGPSHLSYLTLMFAPAGGQTDLSAYFFRRAFCTLRERGTLGFVSTNSIAQGDTRAGGLRPIRKAGGIIYDATRRLKWPGEAAVIVSVVHISNGTSSVRNHLDGRPVDLITAFLRDAGTDDDPARLFANAAVAFTGGYPYGTGFTFDDSDSDATPLVTLSELYEKDHRNRECVRPYLGGEEMLNHPTHDVMRYVIDFGERTEQEARAWPDLIQILEQKVRPARAKLADNSDGRRRKEFWWRWGRTTPSLDIARRSVSRVMMHPFTSGHLAFAFVKTDVVIASPHPVIVDDRFSRFCPLQSRTHETWVRSYASSLKDDLRYTPTDCFETFPFPPDWETNAALEAAGREYYEYRAALMVEHNEGLTKTYNRFHHPHETNPKILHLRELHAAMDHAVLAAYGWSDLIESGRTACEFIPDYYDDNPDGGDPIPKSIRYRWPDATRDEVLARLLKLNAERAEQERLSGLAEKAKSTTRKSGTSRKSTRSKPEPDQGNLL